MTREQALEKLRFQYPYSKNAHRILPEELDEMKQFIANNEQLGHLEFEYKVNRMYLDRSLKPRNWVMMTELLLVSNAHVYVKPRHL